ncbi:MAG: DUF2490 domain-containing protein [Bacteroidia bacterium]
MLFLSKYLPPSARLLLFASTVALYPVTLISQIGAEAQGGQVSLWTALGIDQQISKKWLSVTDLGFGRHSDPDNFSVLKRQGLNVATQDFIYKANSHWHFTLSFGYWRRNAYDDIRPFDMRAEPFQFRNELRPFQKIYYLHNIGKIKINHVFRTDYRFYYNQDFSDVWGTPFEFRARYLQAWKIPLDPEKKNWFIASDEILSAVDQYNGTVARIKNAAWSPYQITENRFSVYYRRSFIEKRIDLDFGIMHQYWRERPGINTFNISYNLMFDIIIHDPFARRKTSGGAMEEED